MLQSTVSQRVGHNLATEQQQHTEFGDEDILSKKVIGECPFFCIFKCLCEIAGVFPKYLKEFSSDTIYVKKFFFVGMLFKFRFNLFNRYSIINNINLFFTSL